MLLQLYLHFPFCKRKCFYCDFCSAPADAGTVAAYCSALKKEICLTAEKYPGAKVSTVFLGGGTPTLVPGAQMRGVLEELRRCFDLLPDAEIMVFLTASAQDRARRRTLELEQRGTPQSYETTLREIEERDWNDTHRATAPLRQAADAVMLDTTQLDFQASEEALLRIIQERSGT